MADGPNDQRQNQERSERPHASLWSDDNYSIDQVTLARNKSFTGHAIAALVIGCFLWLPGLIATVMFRNEAKRAEAVAGQSLPGVGCLSALLWMYIIGAVVGVLAVLLLLSAIGSAA